MLRKVLEFHRAAFGHGEVAAGDDECAVAAVGGYHARFGVLSQRGIPSSCLTAHLITKHCVKSR